MEGWFSEWCSIVTRSLFSQIFCDADPFVALIPQGRLVADKIQLRDSDKQSNTREQHQIAELWFSCSSAATLKERLLILTKNNPVLLLPTETVEDFIENIVDLWIIYKTFVISIKYIAIDDEAVLNLIHSSCINWNMAFDLLTDWPILSPLERSSLRETISEEIQSIRNTLLPLGCTNKK